MRVQPRAALALLVLLAGCGADKDAKAAPSPSGSATTTNTVAGCRAAAIKAIVGGNLSDPDDSADYPECTGLSAEEINTAAEGVVDDPAVRKAMADIVSKGVDAVETTAPVPTLRPESEDPTPAPTG